MNTQNPNETPAQAGNSGESVALVAESRQAPWAPTKKTLEDQLKGFGFEDDTDIQSEAYDSALSCVILIWAFVRRELPSIRREHPEWFVDTGNEIGGKKACPQ